MIRTYQTISIAAAAIIGVWLLSCALQGSIFHYGFIPLNIILAVIPLAVEPLFHYVRTRLSGLIATAARLLLAAIWLLFIPNAFYILTDFMHLNSDVLVNQRGDSFRYGVDYGRGDGLFVLDSLSVFLATAFGAYVGGLALLHAYRYFQRRWSLSIARGLLAAVLVLSSVGVYIGRFGRWNSWDALVQPWSIASDLLASLGNPATAERFSIVVLTILVFEVCALWVVRQLEHRSPS